MPATTTQGFPYPLPTDPIADGADAIKALAQKIDDIVGTFAAGTIAIQGTGATSASAPITFPAGRFTVAPVVVATVTVGAVASVTAVTAAGATVGVKRTDDAAFSSTFNVYWIAVQV